MSDSHHEGVGRFEKFFMRSAGLLCILDADGRFETLNACWEKALGYPLSELVGRRILDIVHPDDRPRVGDAIAALGEEMSSLEVQTFCKDGTRRWLQWDAWREPEERRIHAIVRDVTERRQLEQSRRSASERILLHMHQTSLGWLSQNVKLELTEWNPSATRIFGYTREEVLGRGSLLIVPEPARVHVATLLEELIQGGTGISSRNENITKDGRIIMCEWYNTPLVDEEGRVIGIASLVEDVTAQHTREAELQQQTRIQAETIQRLSTPVIEVWEGVLALPLIGAIDDERAARMLDSLLAAIVRTRAAFAIIDFTGVEGGRVESAEHVLKMVQAAQLLGSRCLLSGMSPATAQATIESGMTLPELSTFGTLRAALSFALASAGVRRERIRPDPR